MKRKVLLLLCVLGIYLNAFAQQETQYSMYMFNQLLINPAVTGTEDYMDTKVGYRQQWVGVADAPQDYYGTFHTPLGKVKPLFSDIKPTAWHGVGAMVNSETTGPLSINKIYGTYAYHLPISSKYVLSMGTSLGFQNYNINKSKLNFGDTQTDNTITGNTSTFTPDGSIGGWLYSKDLYVGVSILQLFNNKTNISDGTTSDGQLSRHYFITAGYKIKLNDKWSLVPSFLAKALNPAPVQFDINAKLRYQNKIWFGTSYRNKDAIVFLIGMTIDRKIDIGYSYDYSISALQKYTAGSHELLVGFHLPKKKLPSSHSYFW